MSNNIRVAVLRGGPSSEYEVSLRTGSAVLKNIPEKYKAYDVFIDKEGNWNFEGTRIQPYEVGSRVDVVFNALHGEYGEDGKVQKILEDHAIPFTGSGSLASAIGMNKSLSKNFFKFAGIKTAIHLVITQDEATPEKILEIFKTFPHPSIVKPVSAGSSVGVSIVRTFDDLPIALQKAFSVSPIAMIEEYIDGVEATCGVISKFRGKEVYSLLPIEIRKPKSKSVFDYEDKYSPTSGAEEICPGNFSEDDNKLFKKPPEIFTKLLI